MRVWGLGLRYRVSFIGLFGSAIVTRKDRVQQSMVGASTLPYLNYSQNPLEVGYIGGGL